VHGGARRGDNKAVCRILIVTLLVSAATTFGQSLIDPAKGVRLAENFEVRKNDKPLRCEVVPIQPQLNFSFRFQAGYVFRVPLSQFEGAGHHWSVLTRVTPANEVPATMLGAMYHLPRIPKSKQIAEWGGAFWVGEGSYNVEWLLFDESSRVCREQWKIDAKLNPSERGINPGIAPGAVAQVSFRRWSAEDRNAADAPVMKRLTVLLHAAPLYPRLTRFRVQDRLILLGSLASLLESVPARSVRLVIFNLDQQKELFRQDAFTPDAFDQASQSLSSLQLQLVDYKVLTNQRGHINLLTDLINEEFHTSDPSDAVIFIGPATRYFDKLLQNGLEEHAGAGPRFFYFQYKPNMRASAESADSIELAVKKVHGRKFEIRTPEEFARAIKQLESGMVPRN